MEGRAFSGQPAQAAHILPVQPARQTTLQEGTTAFGVIEPWQVAMLWVVILGAGIITAWAMMRMVDYWRSRPL